MIAGSAAGGNSRLGGRPAGIEGSAGAVQNSETTFAFHAVSDPMRLFIVVVSPIFVGIGVMAIVSGGSAMLKDRVILEA